MFGSFCDLKFVEKNDKKSTCKVTKKEIKVGDPVWVVTKYRTPRGKRTLPVPSKWSVNGTLSEFIMHPSEFYKIIRGPHRNFKQKSLKQLVYEQIKIWVDTSHKYFKQVEILQTERFLRDFLSTLDQRFPDRNRSVEESDAQRSDFKIKAICFILKHYNGLWNFAFLFTHEDEAFRRISTKLDSLDFDSFELEELEKEIKNWYQSNIQTKRFFKSQAPLFGFASDNDTGFYQPLPTFNIELEEENEA